MTYRELAEKINGLSTDQQGCNVNVLLMDSNEVAPVMDFVTDWTVERDAKGVDQVEGILDNGHPYLTVAE